MEDKKPFPKKWRYLLIPLGLILLYLSLWPVTVDPVVWSPAPAPGYKGDYAANRKLASAQRFTLPQGVGPEDIALDAQNRIYGGLLDGRIFRMQSDGTGFEIFATTGGRPLGLHFDSEGNLIVADAKKGLVSISPKGKVEVLSTKSNGVKFLFTDDLDIARDGKIYFSDASHKFEIEDYKLDIIENRPNGRLLVYDPKTKQTTTLLKNLYFANGVALSSDESFVLVNETSRYRIRRYWLQGPKKGEDDIFIDNLPGFPDGVSANRQGTFWVAIISPRNPLIDGTAGSPFLRKVMARLPAFLQPAPEQHAFALGLDETGKVVHNLQDPQGKNVHSITSVEEVNGYLYFGNLAQPTFARFKLPDK